MHVGVVYTGCYRSYTIVILAALITLQSDSSRKNTGDKNHKRPTGNTHHENGKLLLRKNIGNCLLFGKIRYEGSMWAKFESAYSVVGPSWRRDAYSSLAAVELSWVWILSASFRTAREFLQRILFPEAITPTLPFKSKYFPATDF